MCSLLIDRRLLPGETAADGLAELRDFVLGRVSPDRHGAIAFHLDMELPPMEVDANNPLVGELLEASRLSGGTNMAVGGWTAACDGGLLVGTAAIPTVLYGPGSIVNQAHRADESVPVDEIAIAARVYARVAARAMFGLIA
jgi:acetylornithine deacetylase